MKLTVLGSAGTYPGPDRPCSSYLLEHEGFSLLVDAGNGSLGSLQRVGDLATPDAVAISHMHGDHYLDLVTYTYARHYHPDGAMPRLLVHGPSRLREHLAGAYLRDVDSLLSSVYDLRSHSTDTTTDIGPFRVTFTRVNHPVECYAIRFEAGGRTLVYSADTGECSDLVDLARGADLLLCEASYLDGVDNPPDVHLTGRQAGEHATRAGVGRLLLTHLVPWGDEARTLTDARSSFDGELDVARTLAVHDI